MTTIRNIAIETSRLKIIPLNKQELEQYLQADDVFEKQAGFQLNGRKVAPDVKEMVVQFTLPRMEKAAEDNYLFYTFWVVLEKSTQLIVAELGFKGEPNDKAEIEIGYGTMPSQRGKGFMTEAVGGMIEWGKSKPGIDYILAETAEINTASIRVLQKNSFECFEKRKKMLWWKIEVK
jgi:ribosomal-protein-alanine N-acetyltransferase